METKIWCLRLLYIYINMQNTTIKSVAEKLGVIAAQAMNSKSDDSGFVFIHCKILGTGDMYLGRAWKETSRVVFAYTYMGGLINSGGWMSSKHQKYASIYPSYSNFHLFLINIEIYILIILMPFL